MLTFKIQSVHDPLRFHAEFSSLNSKMLNYNFFAKLLLFSFLRTSYRFGEEPLFNYFALFQFTEVGVNM